MNDIDTILKMARQIKELESELERLKRTRISSVAPKSGFSGEQRIINDNDGVKLITMIKGKWYKTTLEEM